MVMLLSTSIVNVIGSFLRVSLIDDIHCSSRRHMQVNSSRRTGSTSPATVPLVTLISITSIRQRLIAEGIGGFAQR